MVKEITDEMKKKARGIYGEQGNVIKFILKSGGHIEFTPKKFESESSSTKCVSD